MQLCRARRKYGLPNLLVLLVIFVLIQGEAVRHLLLEERRLLFYDLVVRVAVLV